MGSAETKGKQEFLEEEPDRIEKTDGNNSKVGQVRTSAHKKDLKGSILLDKNNLECLLIFLHIIA